MPAESKPRRRRTAAQKPPVQYPKPRAKKTETLESQDATEDQNAAVDASLGEVIEGEVIEGEGNGEAMPPASTELRVVPARPTGFDPGTAALALLTDEEFASRLAMLKKGRERIATIQRELLVVDVDYGIIPGTDDRHTLFKAGAEKLCQFYGLVSRIEVTYQPGDNVTVPGVRYDAACFIHHGSTDGPIVATGYGTANSWEKRYLRASKLCPDCKQAALIKSKFRDNTWHCFAKKGGCGRDWPFDHPDLLNQTDPKGSASEAHDLGNTLAKMAEKRSHVDATLRATATSGLFTQDVVEDENDDTQLGENTTVTKGGAVLDSETGEVQGRIDEDGPEGQGVDDRSHVEQEGLQGTDSAAETESALLEQVAEEKAHAANLNELAAAGTAGDPQTGQINADAIRPLKPGEPGYKEPEPEFTPSGVEGVGRGGSTSGANGVQIEEVKRLSKTMGLGPYGLIEQMMAAGVLDVKVGAAMKEIADRAAAARALAGRLDRLSSNDVGKLIHDLRGLSDSGYRREADGGAPA